VKNRHCGHLHQRSRILVQLSLGAALIGAAVGTPQAEDRPTPSKRPPHERRNFVACPILQDTDTVPCWMADYNGERYFLGIQTDSGGWSPPYLGHKVLVEGKLAGGPRICGGIPLTSDYPQSALSSGSADDKPLPNPPVSTAMRELDASCNTLLPAALNFNIKARRGPGPNTAASALRPLPQPAQAQTPTPPFKAQTFTLTYEFDSELASRSIGEVLKAVQYARAIDAAQITIVGHRGATLLSDGSVVEEIPKIATLRVNELVTAVQKLGIPSKTKLAQRAVNQPEPADGVTDPVRRRAEITVVP
jgi:hypothetical protein